MVNAGQLNAAPIADRHRKSRERRPQWRLFRIDRRGSHQSGGQDEADEHDDDAATRLHVQGHDAVAGLGRGADAPGATRATMARINRIKANASREHGPPGVTHVVPALQRLPVPCSGPRSRFRQPGRRC